MQSNQIFISDTALLNYNLLLFDKFFILNFAFSSKNIEAFLVNQSLKEGNAFADSINQEVQ